MFPRRVLTSHGLRPPLWLLLTRDVPHCFALHLNPTNAYLRVRVRVSVKIRVRVRFSVEVRVRVRVRKSR